MKNRIFLGLVTLVAVGSLASWGCVREKTEPTTEPEVMEEAAPADNMGAEQPADAGAAPTEQPSQ